MKFSSTGTVKFGGTATISDKVKGAAKKIIMVLSGKPSESKAEDPKLFGAADVSGEISYEMALDISAEELVEVFRLSRENDIHSWDLMKSMGRDILKAAPKVREVVESEVPQWLKANQNFNKTSMSLDEEEDILREEIRERADKRRADRMSKKD